MGCERAQRQIYRLVLPEHGAGFAREIEFEETSVDAAISIAQRVCGDLPVEIFEGDRRLGRLARSRAGFFIVS